MTGLPFPVMTTTTGRPSTRRGTLDVRGQLSAGVLDVLAVGRGHLKLTITDRNPVEVEKARRVIEDMIARRFAIFIEHEDGTTSRVKAFDADAMTYIIDDTMDTVPAADAPDRTVDTATKDLVCAACGTSYDKRPGPGAQPKRCPACIAAGRKAPPPGRRAVPVSQARATGVGRTAGG